MGDFCTDGVPGEECGGLVCVLFMQRAMVFGGLTEVPFKLGGRGLEAFNGVGEVFTVWAREITWVKWGRKVTGEKFD